MQEDLIALGRLVLQLCARNLAAAQRENLHHSMEILEQRFSPEMKHLVWQLLSAGDTRSRCT